MVCTLTSLNSIVFPIEGEGGNTNFSPQNKLEIELLKFLLKDKEYISFEDVVSGRGLKNIYKFLKFNNKQTIKNSILPDQIGALALKNDIVEEYSLSPDFDNRWRTGGSFEQIVLEAKLDPQSIWDGIFRFAFDRSKRINKLKKSIPDK